MEIKFVDDNEVPGSNYSQRGLLLQFLRELQKHPNKWGEFPRKYANSSVLYQWRKAFPKYEFSAKYGEATGAKANQRWVIYVRYTGGTND